MLTGIIVAALAVWQVVLIWDNSELFASRRARIEIGEGFWSRLLRCSFCLSNWVAAAMIGLIVGHQLLTQWGADSVAAVLAAPVQIFAAARVANLGRDFFKPWDRTPRYVPPSLEETQAEDIQNSSLDSDHGDSSR